MNPFYQYFHNIVAGAWSLIAGMGVTIRYFFKPPVTVEYPRHRLSLPEAYRGHIELVTFPETGGHGCVACGECARVCPSKVIKVQGEKEGASSHNRARFYFIDFSRCSLCGLCVENCPQQAIKFSREYEQAGEGRYYAVIDLIARQGGKTA
ncbi:MAG: NADH-quinone oxidoreductase subunit I [Thermodesulfobacteriota bacterium]